jgi:transposase-like protein
VKREKNGSRRAYSPEFREEALRPVASGTASIAAIARELGSTSRRCACGGARRRRRAARQPARDPRGREPAVAAEERPSAGRAGNPKKSDGVLRADRVVKHTSIECPGGGTRVPRRVMTCLFADQEV